MIAIISDIHGNYVALQEVFKELDTLAISEVYCLGDIVGYYSQVNECCEELRRRNVKCILGNHDWYMISGTVCERSHSVNDCISYQKKIITKDNKIWLSSLPTIMIVSDISMVHGGWINPIDEYIEPSKEYFERIEGKYFLSGHTHIQQFHIYGDKVYCNPGSIGQPRDGDNRAAFALFDKGDFFLRRVEYDISKVERMMDKAGFNSYYYSCLRDASKNLHT